MLYKYKYIKRHTIHGLNKYLLYFFRKIRTLSSSATFRINGAYFHSDFSEILKNSPELKKKFKMFFDSYKILSDVQKTEFYNKVVKCQCVSCFFEDISVDCSDIKINSIQQLIGNNSLYELMKHLYDTLKSTRWKIIDHYIEMYNEMPQDKVCPFCGIESMHQTFREDYDHLLPKSIYPLLSVNLQNLAPMCSICNEKAKKEIDILYKNGSRRSFAYPYTTELSFTLNFSGSIIPQTDLNNQQGSWHISVLPQSDINVTWFEVFNIERRYLDDYFRFDIWTSDFVADLIRYNQNVENEEQLKCELLKTAKTYERYKLRHSNIIKAPLFYFLANCNNHIFYNSLLKEYNNLKRQIA